MYNLGLCYAAGRGIIANQMVAREWLTKSANAGYQPARQRLAQVQVEGWANVLQALDSLLGDGGGGGGRAADHALAEEIHRRRFEGRMYDDQMRRADPSYIAPIR